MPEGNPRLISALRETAGRLSSGAEYEWGHMGRCNCGHLVQIITNLSDREIVQSIDFKLDEWTEHAKEFCEGTGQKVDDLFRALHRVGFGHQDIVHLEYLSDEKILDGLPGGKRYLQKNSVEDVTLYMSTMADLLEAESATV